MEVAGSVAVLLLLSATPLSSQLIFLMEPPPRLSFSNSTGARVSCAAHGSPAPTITWLTEDGVPVTDITGLREALPNGTLWLGAFSAAQYRSDVHAAVYRCRASGTVGTVLSRDMRLEAVMDVPWELRVQPTHGVAGGAALLTCAAPAAIRAHVTVTRWFKDGAVLAPMAADAGGRYIIGGSRGDVLVVRDARTDDASSYSCEGQHALTGEKKRSASAMIAVSLPTGSMAPRILTISEDETVPQGGDIRLVCCAIGSPPPTYSWFRHANGRLSPVANNIRISVSDQVLVIRRAVPADAGLWTCRAHNQFGEQRRDARLRVRARLVVGVHPQLQIANSGSSVSFNCSVEGGEARVRWLHDGVPVGGGERALRVHGVARAHRGMYQCVAERDLDSAQAAAELRLGDTAPELHYTFIEQALHPGPALALRCSASGSPPPRFTWLLDMQPLEEHNTQHRISQFMSPNGDVVSYLNISSVRPDDGGRYACRAHNTRGAAEHATRLNVYGPPSIRNIGPVRVVAGVNATIYCPYSGFPISEIRWQRGGLDVGLAGGALRLWPAEPADAAAYSCRATAPSGQYAQKDVQIFVRNPPKIAGFSFPTDLVEGSSIQVLCGITSGDKPVYFSWLKDGQHIPSNLQVQEKSLDEFSFLIFSHVTSKHSGEYTCVASNTAAEVNHTARLAVKVAPSWVSEPQDVSVLLGAPVLAHCAAAGHPEPRVTWLVGQGTSPSDFRPITRLELPITVLKNGSLSATSAMHSHEGRYMCRSDNGVGRGLSKLITIAVNEPAHFEHSSRNMSVRRAAGAALACAARGDAPLRLAWTHNAQPLDLATYRVSVSEKRSDSGASSTLSIAHAQRHDSGVYRCRAENAFGRDELLIYLAVQEFPEAPRGLEVLAREGRAARVAWRSSYDGNAPLRAYRVQCRVVGDAPRAADWAGAPARDVAPDQLARRQVSAEPDSETVLQYRLDGLRPATAYALRVAAVNDIGESEYSDSVIVQTLEEAPSDPPRNVEVHADVPGELVVKWQAPPQESWHGELLGYAVWWRGDNSSGALTVAGGAAGAVLPVAGGVAGARLEVRVRAVNAVGAGPACAPLAAAALDDAPDAPPQHLRCEPLSSQSIRVWWEPPSRGGSLLSYEISYQMTGDLEAVPERRRGGDAEAQLVGLRSGAYSVQVAARTAAGAGPPARATCATLDDVPGPPADVKVTPSADDTVVVSWLAPTLKNGKIRHYTVYNRLQRSGQQSHVLVPSAGEEQMLELRAAAPHDVWVSAATAAGEGERERGVGAGERGAGVARAPAGAAGAKLWSFPRRIVAAEGARVELWCGAAGSPAPRRAWSRTRAPALSADARLTLDGARLVIPKLEASLADNYTCVVRNPWGEDRGVWELRVRAPPARPRLRLVRASPAALAVAWDAADALSFTLEWARGAAGAGAGAWQTRWVSGDERARALRRLACGAPYRLRLTAHNIAGASTPSDVLEAATSGGMSKAAPEQQLVSSNSSCVRLNLLTWDSNGCPLLNFVVSVKAFEESSWRSRTVALEPQVTTFCGLQPACWYHLKVVAASTAGSTTATYYFSTLTENGERIAAPARFPSGGGESAHAPGALLGAAAALLLVLLSLAVFAYKRRASSCWRKGYEQSGSEEDKSVEKRDNRRNCQQVYTSSPSKHPAKKDQQELYEISPYATFSMGAACDTAGALRTFGRAEPAPLAAPRAPHPRPHAHSHPHAHPHAHEHTQREAADSDDCSLSRARTLMVRRAESDSDSSGSPCAECTSSVSYRMPLAPAKGEEAFRAVTDSSAESCGSGPRLERARRRPRRHHTPTSTRYQQRQETERRDFTIHV